MKSPDSNSADGTAEIFEWTFVLSVQDIFRELNTQIAVAVGVKGKQ